MSGRDEARWARLMALLEPIHPQAVATARRLCRSPADGDDLYHEALLRAFDQLHALRDPSRFRSWFFAILLNRHRSHARGGFWKRMLPWSVAFPGGAAVEGEAAGDAEGVGAVRAARALATLSAEQREAVVLFEIDGYSIEEIARFQRASVAAVKSRLTRGRERLRQWYERHGLAPVARVSAAVRPAGISRVPIGRLAHVSATGEERGDE